MAELILNLFPSCKCCSSPVVYAANHCPRCGSRSTLTLDYDESICVCDDCGITFNLRATVEKVMRGGTPKIRFTASDGSVHEVNADQIHKARAIDPAIRVWEN